MQTCLLVTGALHMQMSSSEHTSHAKWPQGWMTYSNSLILKITQFVSHWKINGLEYQSTPKMTRTVSSNNVNQMKRKKTTLKQVQNWIDKSEK